MPRTLAESRLLRFVTFTALYVAQGLPWGFISVGYQVLLADLGFDNAAVGVAMGLAYLPWAFKVAWGPLLDAVPALRVGRRRPFIIASQLMMGATLLALMMVDPRQSLGLVTVLLFLNNTFASLQDVAVDAMAVDLLHEDERGRANSFMWAGKSLGVVAGGGGGTLVAKYLGWDVLFVGLAIAVWAIMLLPLFLRERPPAPDDRPVDARLLRLLWFLLPVAVVGAIMYGLGWVEDTYAGTAWVPVVKPFAAVVGAVAAWPLVDRPGFDALRRSFAFATPWWGVVVGILTPLGYAMVSLLTTKLLRTELKLSEDEIATLSGVVEPASGVVGALIGGVLADRLGARRAIAALMVAMGLVMGGWGASPAWWHHWWPLIAYTATFNALVYAYNAATLGMFMALSNPRISATHFAVYMAMTNLTYAAAAPLAGVIADHRGFPYLFVLAAALQLVTIVTLWPLDVARAARVYAGDGAGHTGS